PQKVHAFVDLIELENAARGITLLLGSARVGITRIGVPTPAHASLSQALFDGCGPNSVSGQSIGDFADRSDATRRPARSAASSSIARNRAGEVFLWLVTAKSVPPGPKRRNTPLTSST